jgi:hypothetical protein
MHSGNFGSTTGTIFFTTLNMFHAMFHDIFHDMFHDMFVY